MIRCIQIGGLDGPIIQGPATDAHVADLPSGPQAMATIGGVTARLIPSKRRRPHQFVGTWADMTREELEMILGELEAYVEGACDE